jgi:hypothetical protein
VKGFTREEPLFSQCGLNCGLCTMYLGNYCPGCGGGEGNQSCAIAQCAIQHANPTYCWECSAYPCTQYEHFDRYDSFVPHRNRKHDVAAFHAMGKEAYLAMLRRKMAVLNELLTQYNDGRHKTFFCTAVYLLDLADIQTVMDQLHGDQVLAQQPRKARAKYAAALLSTMAHARDVSLKLIKNPNA